MLNILACSCQWLLHHTTVLPCLRTRLPTLIPLHLTITKRQASGIAIQSWRWIFRHQGPSNESIWDDCGSTTPGAQAIVSKMLAPFTIVLPLMSTNDRILIPDTSCGRNSSPVVCSRL